jgi:sulfite dehydrogenase (cytochrome) subunit B
MRINLILLIVLVHFACAADDWQLPAEKPAFKPGAGSELAQANCLMCHSHDYIATQPAFTREQWKASVIKMQQKFGAPIPAETVDSLVEYLTKTYGRPPPAK